MTTICPRCSRANVAEAVYCYFDGIVLPGKDPVAAPAPVVSSATLVFPSGETCRTFDDFVRGCDAHWMQATEMLQQGRFQPFFSAMGRNDLVKAADEAAHFPDKDQGLDHLLAKVPSKAVAAPRLEVEPEQVNLGKLKVGENRRFQLELRNSGGRIISGSLSANCKWLAPADNPRAEARLVQFTRSASVTVEVRGKLLRAGPRALEGSLVLDTNAGMAVVRVMAEVPPQPFADRPLDGARTPRELADKARAAPQEAARLFENGAVRRWYEANGWSYPVASTASGGMTALQQYFEALGLGGPAAPISPAAPGTSVVAPSAPPATVPGANAPQPGKRAQPLPSWLTGASADPPPPTAPPAAPRPASPSAPQALSLPALTSRPLTPTSPAPPQYAAPARPAPLASVEPAPVAPGRRRWLDLAPVVLLALPLGGIVASDFLRDLPRREQVAVKDEPPEQKNGPAPEASFQVQIQDEPDEMPVLAAKATIVDEPEERTAEAKLAPVKVDIKDEPAEGNEPGPVLIDKTPLVRHVVQTGRGEFGVSTTPAFGQVKRLTYSLDGDTNTTVVKLDGAAREFGGAPGRWLRHDARFLADGIEATPGSVSPSHSTYELGGVRFHQVLEIVPGQSSVIGGAARRRLDTVLVRWVLHNADSRAHQAGLRLQLDTLIGGNDGVPFTVPGRPGLVNTFADFTRPADVPDFLQALEIPNVNSPGTVAHMTVKVGGKIEAPARLSLTYWPGWDRTDQNWDIPIKNIGKDSAVVLYWPEKPLAANQKRVIGFAYGLGAVTASSDKLGLTLGGSFEPGENFTATAYVDNPVPGQTVRLELPDGLKRIEGAETQPVPPVAPGGRQTSLVTWKVQVERTGSFRLAVHSSTGISQAKTISIERPDAPGGGKFALDLVGKIAVGESFQVVGAVGEPVPGQTLTLHLPKGMELVEGALVQKAPSAAPGKDAIVAWRVKVLQEGKFAIRVASSTGTARTKTVTLTQPDPRGGNFKLALTGDISPGKMFQVSARVSNPVAGQTLTLKLPAGLERVEGAEQQPAPPGTDVQLAWKVKAQKTGEFLLGVASSTGVTQRKRLVIEAPSAEAGRFSFELAGDIRPGKEFKVVAQVDQPTPGQTLNLVLPKELKLVDAEARQKVAPTPQAKGATVTWRVQVLASGRLPIRVESSTGAARTKTVTLTPTQSTLFGQ